MITPGPILFNENRWKTDGEYVQVGFSMHVEGADTFITFYDSNKSFWDEINTRTNDTVYRLNWWLA